MMHLLVKFMLFINKISNPPCKYSQTQEGTRNQYLTQMCKCSQNKTPMKELNDKSPLPLKNVAAKFS
jgi:hypothetical protein